MSAILVSPLSLKRNLTVEFRPQSLRRSLQISINDIDHVSCADAGTSFDEYADVGWGCVSWLAADAVSIVISSDRGAAREALTLGRGLDMGGVDGAEAGVDPSGESAAGVDRPDEDGRGDEDGSAGWKKWGGGGGIGPFVQGMLPR
jgi:hypothetical protein